MQRWSVVGTVGLSLLVVIGLGAESVASDVPSSNGGDEHEHTYAEVCHMIDGIKVCLMKDDYCAGDEKHFDCDDYAYCYDEVCESLGIPAWQFQFWCELDYRYARATPPFESVHDYWCAYLGDSTEPVECWFQDSSTSSPDPESHVDLQESWGHVVNIVKLPPPDGGTREYYCMVEARLNVQYGCWYQDASTTEPVVPDSIRDRLQCDGEIQDERLFEDGHSPTAGEPVFSEDPEMAELYEEQTGYPAPE